MKVYKPNGNVIECSVDEYKQMLKVSDVKTKTSAVREHRKIVSRTRVSSCKRWTKKEDMIIMANDVTKSHKILPKRSIVAIYGRRSALKSKYS